MSDAANLQRPARPDHGTGERPKRRRRWPGQLFGFSVLLLLIGTLGFGAWRYITQQRQVVEVSGKRRDLVPGVRVAAVRASDGTMSVSLPATTSPFVAANLFARASGYIDKRKVDIGDRVTAGQLLVEIAAPELDDQIAQAQATLAQNQATVLQVQANLDLARVTWARDKPLVEKGYATQEQGTIDVQNIKAIEASLAVAQANVRAQAAQLKVLAQEKAYQTVVAPFDGVITQRNIDIGSLVQADSTSGTFMFTIMQGNVIRTQVFVPQDEAFGLKPGIDAVVHVPEIPDRTFPGKVTRIADALQPGSRTLLTEIDIPNHDGVLAPGIYCTIELHMPRKTPSFSVSADAVIFNAGGLQVAVVENGVVHLRKVSVVRDLGQEVEINSGVKAGDQVVLNPAVDLADGSKVRVRAPATPTS